MSNAKLSITPETTVTPPGKRITIDCPHATTTAVMLPSPTGTAPTEDAMAAIVVTRHYLEEGCACTKALRRRYGVS